MSCEERRLYTYELTVEIHYPTRIDTVKLEGVFLDEPQVSSYKGSNTIYVDGGFIGQTCIESSAPIKIIDSKLINKYVNPN